jgi:hypothetical protein
MPWTVSPKVEQQQQQQQPMLHDYTKALNACGELTNANAGLMALGALRETSSNGNDWTGSLCLNGARVHVRAHATEAVSNPYVLSLNFY